MDIRVINPEVRNPTEFLPFIERLVGKPVAIYHLNKERYGEEVSPQELLNLPSLSNDFGVRAREKSKEVLGNLRYVKPSDGRNGILQYRGRFGDIEAVWLS
ncbi:MAG: hypothetical protein HYW26_03425 [Candidatus Aenigmarchaeota archaeon]|nr:hypothetical protein [Candidatus Aenigmarchaeota archaeon]